MDDLGKGFGPALIAALLTFLPRAAAFNAAIAGWLLCGLLLCLSSFTLANDEAAVQWRLAQVAAQALPHADGFLGTVSLEGVLTPAMSGLTGDTHTPRSIGRGGGAAPGGAMLELGVLAGGSDASEKARRGMPQSVAEELPLLEQS